MSCSNRCNNIQRVWVEPVISCSHGAVTTHTNTEGRDGGQSSSRHSSGRWVRPFIRSREATLISRGPLQAGRCVLKK
jgi:hypothetical protein